MLQWPNLVIPINQGPSFQILLFRYRICGSSIVGTSTTWLTILAVGSIWELSHLVGTRAHIVVHQAQTTRGVKY